MALIAEKGTYMVLISLLGLVFSIVNVYIASRTSIGFGTDLRTALFGKNPAVVFLSIWTISALLR
ncbi:MAG: hypothetical protein V8S95_13180 [Odoribacter sp.]